MTYNVCDVVGCFVTHGASVCWPGGSHPIVNGFSPSLCGSHTTIPNESQCNKLALPIVIQNYRISFYLACVMCGFIHVLRPVV